MTNGSNFQEALDCSYPEEKNGCKGGWYTAVWRYIQSGGRLAAMRDVPYFPAGAASVRKFLTKQFLRKFNFFQILLLTIVLIDGNDSGHTNSSQWINVVDGTVSLTESRMPTT